VVVDVTRGCGTILVGGVFLVYGWTIASGGAKEVSRRGWLIGAFLLALGLAAYYFPALALVLLAVVMVMTAALLGLMFYVRWSRSRDRPLNVLMLLAAELGLPRVASLLIKMGADSSVSDGPDMSLMSEALRRKDRRMVAELLAKGASASAPMGVRNLPPIIWAATYDDPAMVLLLLQHGADVNSVVEERGAVWSKHVSPLFLALTNKSPIMVALLLEHGADPNMICETNSIGGIANTIGDCVGYYTAGQGPIPRLFAEPGYARTYLSEALSSPAEAM
jgi:hypothetical protein